MSRDFFAGAPEENIFPVKSTITIPGQAVARVSSFCSDCWKSGPGVSAHFVIAGYDRSNTQRVNQAEKEVKMMCSSTGLEITNQIVAKGKSLGASLAGVADVGLLKQSPSHLLWPQLEKSTRAESRKTTRGIKPGEVAWPQRAGSAVVIAVEHSEAEPELDWWHGEKSPPGNHILMKINKALSVWIEETFQITTHKLPYHVERGGIFLKDSAVLAGLGCIGKSNILVTPEFGPRVRLRAMLLEQAIAPTGPIDFDPCDGCSEPCRRACPQMAFNKQIFSPTQMGSQQLPGRNGCFSRPACNRQMKADIDAGVEEIDPGSGQMEKIIKYCRRCELVCPAGRDNARALKH